MFGDVWRWAGSFRKRETNIGSPPHEIELRLQNLLDHLKAWQVSEMSLIEQAVVLHHLAVQIHPFPNGNGRWARMVANILVETPRWRGD